MFLLNSMRWSCAATQTDTSLTGFSHPMKRKAGWIVVSVLTKSQTTKFDYSVVLNLPRITMNRAGSTPKRMMRLYSYRCLVTPWGLKTDRVATHIRKKEVATNWQVGCIVSGSLINSETGKRGS